MQRVHLAREENRWLTAAIRAEIWNVNMDLKAHRPLTAADFMPGAKKDGEVDDEMRDFIDRIQRGEKFQADPVKVAEFRTQMEKEFSGIDNVGKATHIGPRGLERVTIS